MWTRAQLLEALDRGTLLWRAHALERMLERGITRAEVKETIRFGEIIEQYTDDRPFPSALLCRVADAPLHTVVALNPERSEIHVITAYRPDLAHFAPDFKTRIEK
jgi:hypothetical protein